MTTTPSNEQLEGLLERECEVCGSAIPRRLSDSPWQFKRRRYCSRACGGVAQNARRHASIADRLNARISMNGECWEWTGPLKPDGYGRITVKGEAKTTHRVAHEVWIGEIPEGMHVCHRCDNRRCINPAHLFLGTNADNTADRNQKNRQARGETAGRAKLTDAQATEIFHSKGNFREIAEKFAVGETTVSNIKGGRTWQHLGLKGTHHA